MEEKKNFFFLNLTGRQFKKQNKLLFFPIKAVMSAAWKVTGFLKYKILPGSEGFFDPPHLRLIPARTRESLFFECSFYRLFHIP